MNSSGFLVNMTPPTLAERETETSPRKDQEKSSIIAEFGGLGRFYCLGNNLIFYLLSLHFSLTRIISEDGKNANYLESIADDEGCLHGRIRTCNLILGVDMFYPIELRGGNVAPSSACFFRFSSL